MRDQHFHSLHKIPCNYNYSNTVAAILHIKRLRLILHSLHFISYEVLLLYLIIKYDVVIFVIIFFLILSITIYKMLERLILHALNYTSYHLHYLHPNSISIVQLYWYFHIVTIIKKKKP